MITREKMGIHWPQEIILRERRENWGICRFSLYALVSSAQAPWRCFYDAKVNLSHPTQPFMTCSNTCHVESHSFWVWYHHPNTSVFQIIPLWSCKPKCYFQDFFIPSSRFFPYSATSSSNFFFFIALEFMGNTTFGKRSVNLHISL